MKQFEHFMYEVMIWQKVMIHIYGCRSSGPAWEDFD